MDEDMSPRFFALATSIVRAGIGGGKLEGGPSVGAHGRGRLFRRER
jgi:hypothetical protein